MKKSTVNTTAFIVWFTIVTFGVMVSAQPAHADLFVVSMVLAAVFALVVVVDDVVVEEMGAETAEVDNDGGEALQAGVERTPSPRQDRF